MAGAHPLPRTGDVFFDARGDGRALRLSSHHGAGVVVLSLWKAGVCTGTFRLPQSDVQALVTALGRGERRDPAEHPASAPSPDAPAGTAEPVLASGGSSPSSPPEASPALVPSVPPTLSAPSGPFDPATGGPPPGLSGALWPEPGDRRVFPVTDEHEIPPPPQSPVR